MDIPTSLIEKIKDRKCVLFLGSGASASSGGPTGKQLSQFLQANLSVPIENYHDDLSIFSENILKEKLVSRQNIEAAVCERLENLSPSESLKKLTLAKWKEIYTTNYDNLIERAYDEQFYYKLISNSDYCEISPNEIPFYKLHGSIKEIPQEKLIITRSDIFQNRDKKRELMSRLIKSFANTFLFIGYSFNDRVITDLLDELKSNDLWDETADKYALVRNDNSKDFHEFKMYDIIPIKGTLDDFSSKIEFHINNDPSRDLRQIYNNCSIKIGNEINNFDIHTKSLIDTSFDYYIENNERFDPKYFYRGGKISWTDIIKKLDVPRTISITNQKEKGKKISSIDLPEIIKNLSLNNHGLQKILFRGPAAVGKTTILYRLAYELITNHGLLTFICKDISDIRTGLLGSIHKQNSSKPFVIILDSATSNTLLANQIYNEIEKHGLNVIFILSARMSDWNTNFNNNIRFKIENFDLLIDLSDELSPAQSEALVSKLSKFKVIDFLNEYDKKHLEDKFKETNHLMVSLIETVDNTSFDKSISSEYDALSDTAKNAYGLISLVCRYGLAFKWELLQRTLNEILQLTWEDFIRDIIQCEAKDIIKEEGDIKNENYYFTCRHSVIAETISEIHYKGMKKNEIDDIIKIIENTNVGTSEENFVGQLIRNILYQEKNPYSEEQLYSILNKAIMTFQDHSFILHLKGQVYLDNNQPIEALKCFQKNIQDGKNRMYSTHSAGMACIEQAKQSQSSSEKILLYNKAKKYFQTGLKEFPGNPFFEKSCLQLYLMKKNENLLNEDDLEHAKIIFTLYQKSTSKDDDLNDFKKILFEYSNHNIL